MRLIKRKVIISIIVIIIIASVYLIEAFQKTEFPNNVNQIFMKDNKNGWAILNDGSFIKTTNEWKSYNELYDFKWNEQGEATPSISYVNQVLFVTGFLPEAHSIGIYRSKDEGITWDKSDIAYSDVDSGAYQLFSSFIDNNIGYLLYCGGPASGLMTKILYKTIDGGKTFQKINDLSYISGYPTGMTFNKNGAGFITGAYHGNTDSYLYNSNDQGMTWHALTLSSPNKMDAPDYINGYPPYFTNNNGIMILEYVNNQQKHSFVTYHSDDYGKTWNPNGTINTRSISRYSFCNLNTIYIIDDAGKLLKKSPKNNTWN